MRNWVSISEKKNFLKWFLDHHKLKQPEARRLLEYILTRPHILENISFTDKISLKRRTIVISSVQSDEVGFTFYNNQTKSNDISKALGELMSNPMEKFYLNIHFYGKMSNPKYTQLLENPPSDNIKEYQKFEKYSKEVDAIINQVSLKSEIENTRKKIDEALDNKEKYHFNKLVDRLKELEKELELLAN